MSGICAGWRKQNPERIAASLTLIGGALATDSCETVERLTDRGAGVAAAIRFATQQIYQNPRLLIACDAELYNEEELQHLAGGKIDIPQTARTAALLASLYERFGCTFVEKLRGAFAVTIWDREQRKFLAAIDHFGMKRLAYYQDGNMLLVATRVDALARSGEIDLGINARAVANILNFSANLAPETIFAKIHRLAPGTILMASDGGVRFEKYWDIRYGVEHDTDEDRLSRELESVVEQSVAAHCRQDTFTGLGAFLSGGTDSSTVVGMMSRLKHGPVKTFSIGFQEQPFNELGYAQITANKFKTEHHTYLVGPEDCLEALPRMVRCFDEPYGNSSSIPTYFCARLAAQNGVKTLLAGDGGDELFGGNTRYLTDKIFELYQTVPRVLRKGVIEPVLRYLPWEGGLARKARGYLDRSNMPRVERFFSYQFLSVHSPADVFQPDFLAALAGASVLDIPSRHYSAAAARDHLDRLLYVDMKITLADNDLPKVTCMSEAAGIQARFPFLDRSVAEFSGCIPARLKVKGFDKRYLFKRAFRELLPIEVIQKKKHGFGIPVATWLKSDRRMRELSRDTLLSPRAFERGYFRREFIEDLFRKQEADDSTYYGDMLWTFLALEFWHRQVVDEPVGVNA
jgi:asparagine synthase (glutamine-hydrolysing)